MRRGLAAAAVLAVLSSSAAGQENSRFYVGIGSIATENRSCANCDSSGKFFELSQTFTDNVGIEFKHGAADMEDIPGDIKMTYIGLNAGGNFGTDWFAAYGKLGFAWIDQSGDQANRPRSDLAFGLGLRVTPLGEGTGPYLQLEQLRTKFQSQDIDATMLSTGFTF